LDYEEALIHKSNALEQLSIMHKLIHHEQEAENKSYSKQLKILEKVSPSPRISPKSIKDKLLQEKSMILFF